MPYVLFVVGIVVPLIFQNIWAVGSGLLWVSAGAAVLWNRRTASHESRGGLAKIRRPKSGGVQLVWNKALECGNSAIDDQHKQLLDIGNEVLDALHHSQNQMHLTLLVDKLIAEVRSHFRFEEALLEAWSHPITEEHKAAHERLLNKAMELRAKSLSGELSNGLVVKFLVDDLIYKHIAQVDQRFFHEV